MWAQLGSFTSTEVVYGVTGTEVAGVRRVAVMRGGHLAILRSGFGATKESEMAAGDIVPVPGAQFEETLASASPDVLRAMIREFAQPMMDADVEVACNAGYGEVTPGPGELPQRVPAPGVGHPGRDDRAGDPQAAGRGRTSRRSWSPADALSGRWPRSSRRPTC